MYDDNRDANDINETNEVNVENAVNEVNDSPENANQVNEELNATSNITYQVGKGINSEENVRPNLNRPTGGMYSGGMNTGNNTASQGYSSSNTENTDSGRRFYTGNNGNGGAEPRMRLNPIPEEPVKKEKKKGSVAGKIFAAIGLGILLGLAAGATLFIMNQVHDSQILKKADEAIEQGIGDIKDSLGKGEATEAEVPPTDVTTPVAPETVTPEQNVAQPAAMVAYDVSGIAEKVMPSVVSIVGNYTVTSQNFFGQTFSQQTEGSGSGIIIGKDDKTLIIATNNHVVEDSNALKVQFIDGNTAEARIKGTDSAIDLAVIIVDIDDVPADTMNQIAVAKLGDSEALKVGEPAIVIGNALGYGQSVTAGVISAVNRTVEDKSGRSEATIDGLIQTDAAINPGNSGGALVNARGEVVGISSSKISGSAVDSMGFAIPISKAEPILNDIVTSADRVKVAESKVGYLGIGGVTVTSDVSQMYAIPVGVVIREVYEGTGAAEAGLLPGDVIKSVAGKDITSMDELRGELDYHEANTSVELGIYRYDTGEYKEMTFTIRLVDRATLDKAN